jgi:gliding motility-associated-like protein
MIVNFTNIVENDCPGNAIGSVQVNPAGGVPPYSFQWSNGETTDIAHNLPGGNVSVDVYDATGCVQTSVISIPERGHCDLELPNGFSPNGDTYNDGYKIKGIEGYPDNVFRVFNRWGNMVYEKENYRNSDWVGQNDAGEELPESTYFVVLEIRNVQIKKNTFVDLRRFTMR